ncbi:hypothetical protein PLICRDRAFT_39768 [Plicaturopsis crispa FD-325 SS-3]|nr:hypothetical protein PLICRDRAFT_39768 [Plicaturopsis crispa FD-325 SS-3]
MSGTEDILACTAFKYYKLASIVVLYQDHLLTFADEVRCFWDRPFNWFTLLFYFNRYFSFAVYIPIVYSMFAHLPRESCEQFTHLSRAASVICQIPVCLMAAIRVWALYERKIVVMLVTVVIAILALIAAARATVHITDSVDLSVQYGGCFVVRSSDYIGRMSMACAWGMLSLFDTYTFVMTLAKALRMKAEARGTGARMEFVSLLLRDGTIFYFVLFAANAVNVTLSMTGNSTIESLNSTPSNIFSVVITSRLLLNLRSCTPAYNSVIQTAPTVGSFFVELEGTGLYDEDNVSRGEATHWAGPDRAPRTDLLPYVPVVSKNLERDVTIGMGELQGNEVVEVERTVPEHHPDG